MKRQNIKRSRLRMTAALLIAVTLVSIQTPQAFAEKELVGDITLDYSHSYQPFTCPDGKTDQTHMCIDGDNLEPDVNYVHVDFQYNGESHDLEFVGDCPYEDGFYGACNTRDHEVGFSKRKYVGGSVMWEDETTEFPGEEFSVKDVEDSGAYSVNYWHFHSDEEPQDLRSIFEEWDETRKGADPKFDYCFSHGNIVVFDVRISRAHPNVSFGAESRTVELDDDIDAYDAMPLSGVEEEAKVDYASSDQSVVAVNTDGSIKPLAPGTVTITATTEQTANYESASVSYEVTAVEPPSGPSASDEGEGAGLTGGDSASGIIGVTKDNGAASSGGGSNGSASAAASEGSQTQTQSQSASQSRDSSQIGNAAPMPTSGQKSSSPQVDKAKSGESTEAAVSEVKAKEKNDQVQSPFIAYLPVAIITLIVFGALKAFRKSRSIT